MPLLDNLQSPNILPDLNTNTWYRLSNSEEGHALDVINTVDNQDGKLELRREGDYSGQHWRLRRFDTTDPDDDNSDGLWMLETMYLGPEKRLDVYGNNPRKPHLADSGRYTGQRWWLTRWPGTNEYKLSNTYGGLYLALDTINAQEVVLQPQDAQSGTQRWKFTPIQPIEE